MGKTNICRPITFYNHFVPPMKDRGDWEYCSFGAFDGVEIQDKIVKEKASDILFGIWKHQKEFSQKLNGTYTAQTVYAFCYDEEEKEERFWQDETEMPFTFFCRMQFKDNVDLFRKNKERMETYLQNKKGIYAMIYASYDNSDAIIVIKTGLYSLGAKLINEWHQDFNFSFDEKKPCELKNSFTIFAVRQSVIDKTDSEEYRRKLNERERIDFASVRIIERNCNEIQKLNDEIQSQLKAINVVSDGIQPVLGTDDEILFLQNIGWGDFLWLYRRKSGAFYNDYTAGTTTTISMKLPTDQSNIGMRNEKQPDEEAETGNASFHVYAEYAQRMREKIGGASEYKELYMILNLLPKFEGSVFSDYVYFSVLKPLSMLIELMDKGNDDSYYEFIKLFSVYVQNSTKSDRHVMQSMDFNAKIYDIPAKLNAFYTALIYSASEVLNVPEEGERTHTYEFFVIPGVTKIVHVTELYQRVSENKRLMCVEVSEDRFYDVRDIMVIFVHEAAHYVGTAIRKREVRYECILKSVASIYMEYVKSYWMEKQSELALSVSDEQWQALKKRMSKMLWELLEREKYVRYLKGYQIGMDSNSEAQIERIKENNNIYNKHFSFLSQNLYRALMDFIQMMLPNVFGGLVFSLEPLKQRDIYEFVESASEQFMVRYTEPTTRMTIDAALKQLIDVYEESFADLMSISILGLTGRDYLDSMIKSSRQQDISLKTLCKSNALYRIMLVCDVMFHEEGGAGWAESALEADGNRGERIFLLSYMEEMRKIIKEGWETKIAPDEYRTSSFYSLLEKDVYVCAVDYLKQCKKYFNDISENGDNWAARKQLRDFYSEEKANSKNIEWQLREMEKFIHLYKEKMLKELHVT